MGRSHREERRRRSRDRSREGRRHHDDDRRHSSKSDRRHSESRTKDLSKGVEAMRSHLRSGLDSALAGTSEQAGEQETINEMKLANYELTVTESANRHREIERIEEGAFRLSAFQSTAGGAGGRVKKEDPFDRFAAVDKKQDAHDKAMFGPKWRDPVTQGTSENEEKETYVPETKKDVELAGPKFFVDPKVREERWLKLFRERRSRLL